jgi:hypothetical protein
LYAASYVIAYKDDDGEVTDITTDSDLTEAIQYFQAGSDDPPISSAASILSGRSFGSRKITLRVNISVDYDGPSLSDTSSLASMDEYNGRNGSQQSLSSFNKPSSVDFDDDSVTVSSRDMCLPSKAHRSGISETLDASRDEYPAWDSKTSSSLVHSIDSLAVNGISKPAQHSSEETLGKVQQGVNPFADRYALSKPHYPEDPSAVFERLKLQEAADEHTPRLPHDRTPASEDRGAAWLRDQNARTIKSMLGALPEPSDSDGASLSIEEGSQSDQLGDLALHRDPRGKYYYSYTSASSSAPRSESENPEVQSHDSGYDDGPSITSEAEDASMDDFISHAKPRPTSMQLTWLASQQKSFADDDLPEASHASSSHTRPLPHPSTSDVLPTLPEDPHLDSGIPPELLQFLPLGSPPSDILTDCSECGVLLDSIRYVCSVCGENTPVAKLAMEEPGKGKERRTCLDEDGDPFAYPPPNHRSPISSSPASSRTFVLGSSSISLHERINYKPLPSLPSLPSLPLFSSLSSSPHTLAVPEQHLRPPSVRLGYELCSGCIESAGVNHALEVNLAPGLSPSRGSNSPPSPEDAQRALSQWLRSAPTQKGQLRHAYLEKVWAHTGWEDVGKNHII